MKKERLVAARRDLRRKHAVKLQVGEERRCPEPPSLSRPTSIQIDVESPLPRVHHALSADDVLSLLAALPAGATDGIARIHLCLGKEYMAEQAVEGEPQPDPWTGRLGYENLPGIYTGYILGTYSPWSGCISIYAWVYDEESLSRVLPRAASMAYMRLRAAKSLLHEVAHHHDFLRVRRGRWIPFREGRREHYAEQREHAWMDEIGLAWLEHRFPTETAALVQWLTEFAGIKIPLSFIAGDTRDMGRDGRRQNSRTINYPVEYFVADLAEGPLPPRPSAETALAFALSARLANEYEISLRVTERARQRHPELIAALRGSASSLYFLKRYEEAWRLTDRILSQSITDADVWDLRARILTRQKRWQDLLVLCVEWEAALPYLIENKGLARIRAVAYGGLEQWEEMEKSIALRSDLREAKDVAWFRERIYRDIGIAPPQKGNA